MGLTQTPLLQAVAMGVTIRKKTAIPGLNERCLSRTGATSVKRRMGGVARIRLGRGYLEKEMMRVQEEVGGV